MKICLIDWFAYGLFDPKSKIVFGGAQIQLYLIAEALAKDDRFEITFLTDNQKSNRQEIFGKVKVYQFLCSPHPVRGFIGTGLFWLSKLIFFRYLEFFLRLLTILRKINARVYFQRAASAETGLIALACKMLGKKFIYMVAHEQDVNDSYIKNNGLRGKLFLLGLRLADKIICQTKEQQNQLPERLKAKSFVIRSGYPINPIMQMKQEKKDILWVARAEDWKNPGLFIKLAKKFPWEKFTMICPPAENNPQYFKLIKKRAGQIANLKFIEQVPFKKIYAYFARAKVFVSTSLNEGFPNTFIQAAKNMTSIISFKVNPDKIIDKHQIGFCAQGNEKQMARLLKKLLENNKLRQQLAANAYRYAEKYHDIKQTAGNIIANIL